MINKIIKKLLPTAKNVRREIPANKHKIDPQKVDANALKVVQRLKQGGFEAYIVGGAVRDLLLDFQPKDFDVATNATPEQVKACFRRAFIIGKRFRLVHVVFGQGRQNRGGSEVVEVSTFRSSPKEEKVHQIKGNEKTSRKALQNIKLAVDTRGRILRDNVWGTQQEDAIRRDFSINAMYYDPETGLLIDYHNGFADVRNRSIRMIGDAKVRYQEDPVRILRALRFSAKLAQLGFSLDEQTKAPLEQCKHLLNNVPQSRLFDETLKLLQTGHGQASVKMLLTLNLHQNSYPLLEWIGQCANDKLVQEALHDTDQRAQVGKSLTASFLLSIIFWTEVQRYWNSNLSSNMPPHQALLAAIDQVFDAHIGDVSGRGKLAADMREIWLMQPRLEARVPRSVRSMISQPRFRAGYDFLLLRAKTGELDKLLAAWWQAYVAADQMIQADMLEEIRQQQLQQRRANKPKKTSPKVATTLATAAEGNLPSPSSKSKSRQRRGRRKPKISSTEASNNASKQPSDA